MAFLCSEERSIITSLVNDVQWQILARQGGEERNHRCMFPLSRGRRPNLDGFSLPNWGQDMLPVSLPVEMYTAIPQAHLWIVPNGNHFPFKEQSAGLFTETALEFLRGQWKSKLK